MNTKEKANKYDDIVRIWNEHLKKDENEIWYCLAGHEFVDAIQSVISEDISKVINIE
ncbi:hypothetical protein [Heyndrickxia shackletonii]|uniref:hypothetical protein n=1 Tax=Heyndrickxia shackletonii TaxID=157838 RepID=UPI000AD30530|nr:hypothetical protein [Heyndrickxia shackletonii]NEZ02048.1 hypothetical protein [Heyndrickxia shackletonii]